VSYIFTIENVFIGIFVDCWMACVRLGALLEYEIPHYRAQLEARKEYFDRETGCDVWIYLVERDFQKRYFKSWAEDEKKRFCSGCDANGGCEVRS